MQANALRDFVVGLFVIAGLLAIGYLSIQVGGLSYTGPGGLALVGSFDEVGGLLQGLELVRGPLLSEPPERPERPEYLEHDGVWELIMRACATSPSERPSFATLAKELGEIRKADAGGALAGWL